MSVFPRSPCTQFYHFFHIFSLLQCAFSSQHWGLFFGALPSGYHSQPAYPESWRSPGACITTCSPSLETYLNQWLQWGSVKDKVPSAGTLAEVVPYSTLSTLLSFFPTSSLTSPGSWFLISHLHINPHLKVCFWDLGPKLSPFWIRDVTTFPSSWRPCGWAYFQSRPWKLKWMWWWGDLLTSGMNSLICSFKVVLTTPFNTFYFCAYFIMKIILGQWYKLTLNNFNSIIEWVLNMFLLIRNWDKKKFEHRGGWPGDRS